MPQVGLQNIVERLRCGLGNGTSDGELLERYVDNHDEDAFAAIVERHGPKVFAVCRRVLGQRQFAEDAYQATFLVLAKKAHTIRSRAAVGGFLYAIAHRAALEAFAMNRRRKETLVEKMPDSPVAPSKAVDSDVLAMLDEEITNLSETLRAAVVLCELDGVGRSEAAKQLGIAEGTLSSRLAAARKQLAVRLKKRGVVLTAGMMATLADTATSCVPTFALDSTALPIAVSTIANGVLKTMLMTKLKLATLGVVLMTMLGVSTLVPKGGMEASAAPVPKVELKVEGLLWTLDAKSGTLTAFKEDGTKERDVALKASLNFQGFSEDGETLLFLAKKGQLTDDQQGLTLHLGKPSDLAGATDTGIEYKSNDSYLLMRDKKRVVRIELTQVGMVGANPQPMLFKHTMIDLKDKKETAIELPDSVQIMRESLDGKEWIAVHYNDDPNLPGYRYLRIPVAGGKSIPICDTHHLPFFVPSPDGRSHLGIGVPLPPKGELKAFNLYHLSADGKATEIEQFSDLEQRNLLWSPDGKRFLVQKDGDADIIVADIDGKNRKKLFAIPDAGEKTLVCGWFPSKPVAKLKPATKPPQAEMPKRPIAAPLPKSEKPIEDGRVWVYHYKSGELASYSSTGGKEKTLKLKDGDRLRGMTPDGKKLVFVGKGGQLADPKEKADLSLHLRDVNDSTEGQDTGIPYIPGDQFQWSHDGKQVIRVRPVEVGFARAQNLPEFEHTLIDLETKKETKLEGVGLNQQVMGWSPDDKWLLLVQYAEAVRKGNVTNFRTVLHRFDLDKKNSKPIGETLQLYGSAVSPDGKTLFGVGCKHDVPGWCALYRTDIATGKSTEVAHHENQGLATTLWSHSGQRVVYKWYDTKTKDAAHLVFCDPDGKKAKSVLIPTPDGTANEVAILGWFSAVNPPKDAEKPKPPVDMSTSKPDAESFAKAFLADKEFKVKFEHPIWTRWVRCVGDDRSSRELFAEMLGEEGAIAALGKIEADPNQADTVAMAELEKLAGYRDERAKLGQMIRSGPEPFLHTFGENALALYMASFATRIEKRVADRIPVFDFPTQIVGPTSPWTFEKGFSRKYRQDQKKFEPATWKLQIAAQLKIKNPSAIHSILSNNNYNMLEQCLPLAKLAFQDELYKAEIRAASWLYLAESGDAAFLPGIVKYQGDATPIMKFIYGNDKGIFQMNLLVSDLSIAAQLMYHKQNLRDFGFFETGSVDREQRVDHSPSTYGFPDDNVARKAAHEKALAYLKTAGSPKK